MNKGVQRKWTDEEIVIVKQMFIDGKSNKEIMEVLNRTEGSKVK